MERRVNPVLRTIANEPDIRRGDFLDDFEASRDRTAVYKSSSDCNSLDTIGPDNFRGRVIDKTIPAIPETSE
jgi:hypothetical protein